MPDDRTMRERLVQRLMSADDNMPRDVARHFVDALLDELSEPTEAMLDSGEREALHGSVARDCRKRARAVLKAMIDSAKQERG